MDDVVIVDDFVVVVYVVIVDIILGELIVDYLSECSVVEGRWEVVGWVSE